MVFQQEDDLAEPVVPPLKLEAPSNQSLKNPNNSVPELLPCDIKGTPKPKSSPKYELTDKQEKLIFLKYEKDTLARLTARTMQRKYLTAHQYKPASSTHEKQHIPIWTTYHSLTCQDDRPITNVYVLPLIAAPANEWQTLLTVIQRAQHINVQVVGPNRKNLTWTYTHEL